MIISIYIYIERVRFGYATLANVFCDSTIGLVLIKLAMGS